MTTCREMRFIEFPDGSDILVVTTETPEFRFMEVGFDDQSRYYKRFADDEHITMESMGESEEFRELIAALIAKVTQS